MILLLTNKDDLTSDLVILELEKRKVPFIRLNTEDFLENKIHLHPCEGDCKLIYDDRNVFLSSVRSVWYRRPGRIQISDNIPSEYHNFVEKEANEILSSLYAFIPQNALWINHPEKNRRAENKLKQLHIAKQLGFNVPDTILTNDPEEAFSFYRQKGPLICKTLKEGTVTKEKETYGIYTWILPKNANEEYFQNLAACPSLLQKWIPKKSDIRVTVIGSKIFAVRIYSQDKPETSVDWRKPDLLNLRHEKMKLNSAFSQKILFMMNDLELEFAAFDFVDGKDGHIYFLEVNPNGQWGWIQHLTKLPISATLADHLMKSL